MILSTPVNSRASKKIATAVTAVARALAPDVVRIRYEIGPDHTGDPSISFRVVLSDKASQESRLWTVTQRVRKTMADKVRPEEYGLLAYFDFRSKSEQDELKELKWM